MRQDNASRQGVKAGKDKACQCRRQRQGVSRQASRQSVKAGKHAVQRIKKIQYFEQLFNLTEFFFLNFLFCYWRHTIEAIGLAQTVPQEGLVGLRLLVLPCAEDNE